MRWWNQRRCSLRQACILTLGCPKNEADSDAFAGILAASGWRMVDDPAIASMLILNTCAFIEPAVEESLEIIRQAEEWKEMKPGRKLVLAGCLPGRYPADDTPGLEYFDLVIGPGDSAGLALFLSSDPGHAPVAAGNRVNRYLKVSEGCSNNCAYCTIPLIRGSRRDRPLDDILRDAASLAEQGVSEIGMVGQDTAAWRSGETGIAGLAEMLAQRYPEIWFRLYYLHPAHFPENLLNVISAHENVMPYIDMPIQHVSDRVLRRMGRPYVGEHLKELFQQFQNMSYQLSVRTTVIAGYPGETEEDFQKLLNFLKRYDCIRTLAAFPYWPEEGTTEYSRATSEELVPDETVQSRLSRIGEVSHSLNAVWADRLEGRTM
ncbi:MAG: MiaB/RimO family radical SAM methylthiotransferase, partial [Candidatus Aegiribacteria sp.]|nr:MiaB/RimO family radical SAM methylthiotransferase [Candidatus Aegiribacteria sp.]MBD3293972.1 MiaB/RimO family radical SAM methylthiotransferase [Candidatus Fermentibacteria bacterium]